MDWQFAIYCLTSIFALMDPLGAIPIYLSLTQDQNRDGARDVVTTATIVVFAVLVGFLFLGEHILRFFNIGLPAFRTGGGILILLMGIEMLHGTTSRVKHSEDKADAAEHRKNIAIFPLAIPLLAGPGAISNVILISHQAADLLNTMVAFAVITLVTFSAYVILRLATQLNRYLGRTGISIFTRIMGLILVAIAVQFIADGLRELFPGLGG